MYLFSWLPGTSAATRLGIEDVEYEASASKPAPAASSELKFTDVDDSAERLPPPDIFYWSMLHSHL